MPQANRFLDWVLLEVTKAVIDQKRRLRETRKHYRGNFDRQMGGLSLY